MIYIGFLMVALSAGFFVYDKTARERTRADEYSATLALLVYLKGALASRRMTPAEMLSSFFEKEEGKPLSWLSSLSDEGRVNSFLREKGILRSESLLSEDDKSALSAFFLELGRGSAEDDAARVSGLILRFEGREREMREGAEKNSKAAWVLYAAALTGALILMI